MGLGENGDAFVGNILMSRRVSSSRDETEVEKKVVGPMSIWLRSTAWVEIWEGGDGGEEGES